jgi:hypothetical protein
MRVWTHWGDLSSLSHVEQVCFQARAWGSALRHWEDSSSELRTAELHRYRRQRGR